jgi:hypothetical protein
VVDDTEHEQPVSPGIEVVQNFSNEVRAGIVTATELAVTRVTRGYLITGLVSAVVAGSVAWLVASPRPATTSFVLQHPNGQSETCSRTADSGPPHSVFICTLDVHR